MLGDKLFQLRKKKGMSQQEVADHLSITRQTISNWECNQGSPTLDKARELAHLYHVSLDDLIENDIEVMTRDVPHKDLHVLYGLIGKTCRLSCCDSSLFLDSPIQDKVKIIDVNDDWLKVEYMRRKENIIAKEKVMKLIDIDLVDGFEIVGEDK